MFDPNQNGPSHGGFLSRSPARHQPRIENLESREVPAVIGGIVYQDVNLSALFESGDTGIAGTQLSLLDANNQTIARTTSDSSGNYQFTERNVNTNVPGSSSYEVVFNSTATNSTRSGTVQQFDPTLGTLTSVDLIAEGSTNSHVVIENMDAQSATMKTEVEAHIRFNVGGQTLESNPTTMKEAPAAGFDGQANLQGASAADLGNIILSGTFSQKTLTDASDMAAFTGTGTVAVASDVSANVCTCGTGNLIAMAQTQTQGKVKVVYHYTPSTVIGPGQYTVVETQPSGYTDSYDTSDNITPIPNSNQTDTIRVTINQATDQSTTNHFGEVRAAPVTPPPIIAPPPITNPPSKFFYMFNL